MRKSSSILFFAFLLSACGTAESAANVGELSLSLSTQAGGQTYRLSQAEFALKGPVEQEFSAENDDPIALTLPIGSYTLELKDGWVLSRVDADVAIQVAAKLDSMNPAALVIGPATTTQAMLRFSLADGTSMEMATGSLHVGVKVGDEDTDGGTPATDSCTRGLLVNEIDYEQTGVDDAEFVEILNTASCAASLGNVTLELVNGGDGKVYGRSMLSTAGESLAAGARLVVGSAKVLATLPAEVMRMPLGSGGLQNGAPDAVRLVEGSRAIDAFSYEGQVAGSVEGAGAATDDGEGTFSRCPDGFDHHDNAKDFRLVPATPGAVNACP